MLETPMAELVAHTVRQSMAHTLTRHVDGIAEEYTRELLRDEAFKAEMLDLIRAACRRALNEFGRPGLP